MTYITQARINEIARETRRELIAKGYGRVGLDDLKQHVICALNAIEMMACYEEKDAYGPIHETAYYRNNGCAYLAAQDIIFSQADVKEMQRDALTRRRELMKEAGTWTKSHEDYYRRCVLAA